MEFHRTELPDVVLIEPTIYRDDRGFFMETFHQQRFADGGIDASFVQDNLSRSTRGTVRGLHFQIEQAQGKLVHVMLGEIFDVAVDLRRSSPTFGRWVGMMLSDENRRAVYIPPGFAHGFCVTSERADVFYKCTDFYAPQHERTLLWNDPQIGIDWPLTGDPILSGKDRQGQPLSEVECYS
ncbi:dTDP-4-dehydrorhamnose 3,5-epimerase [Maioricimonas rarisocia]|uniref:dTDP-4-dehydrorhamnose 3,5-epimerase n=1 Tax=Maioricimonas rarisocia TaxID=2528026 RepID=A0A517Z9V0_9PLAN|nr:dTDP-4-dehydrorhamnose 3,5-epimerase [Maioricimonas rarisocia]QDU39253.1 dTDP-4-dehydrorhamnose 3,5-epimerase [Maioricimonas rarisocia]